MNEMITVRNTETGEVGEYRARLFRNKRIFPENVFVAVEQGAKPYVAELYKSRSVEEYVEDHPEKFLSVDEDEEDVFLADDLETKEK